jgi:hypothetical protein
VLEGEQNRAEALAHDLAAAREEVASITARLTGETAEHLKRMGGAITTAAEDRQGREQERERAEALARDLAAVREEVVSITARFTAKAAEGLKTLPAMAEEAEDTKQVQAEHERVEALALNLRAAEETKGFKNRLLALGIPRLVKTTSVLPDPGRALHQAGRAPSVFGNITLPEAEPKEVKGQPGRAIRAGNGCWNADRQPQGVEGDCTDGWLVKADELLRRGDVGGARLVLERALREGSELAAFRLAETYDPKRLSAWGVIGTKPDTAKARQLYERACAAGIQCEGVFALRR